MSIVLECTRCKHQISLTLPAELPAGCPACSGPLVARADKQYPVRTPVGGIITPV